MARPRDPTDTGEARAAALAVVSTLRSAGHTACFAGGCVRDELLGIEPADYDVATDATPERITNLFDRTAMVGASFGVILVHRDHISVEVATFRSDGPYTDSRRPDSIQFSNPVQDAKRRDFTINALFLDPLDEGNQPDQTRSPKGGCVIDHVGGLVDLDAHVIRAVGDPASRLAEDHLRALRAVRLASRLSFTIEPATANAITEAAGELKGVSRERVGDEVRRMLDHPSRWKAATLLTALGLDAPVLGSHMDAVFSVLAALHTTASYAAALAAWAIDRGALDRPDGGRGMVRDWRRSLCLTNYEQSRLWDILAGITLVQTTWSGLPIARKKRAAAAAWFAEALAVLAAIDATAAAALKQEISALQASPGGLAPEPLVTGDDLIAQGHSPGPHFKALLDQTYDAQLEGRVQTKAQALELVRSLSV
jgi:tRNA nucleotidyltransferase/poly(A) polymerase